MFIDHWFIYACVFAAVGCGVYAVAHLLDRYRIRLDARLGEVYTDQNSAGERARGRNATANAGRRSASTYRRFAERLLPHRDGDRREFQRRFIQAGFYEPASLTVFFTVKLIFMVGPPIAGFAIAELSPSVDLLTGLYWGSIAGGVGMLLPSFWLERQIAKRHAVLRKALPDFLDLTLICLRGGLSVQAALQRVASELLLAHPVLAEEMGRVKRDIELGAPVDAALRRFADRSGDEGIRTLSTFVRESRRFGVELGDALRNHSDMLRIQREQEAEAMAQKAAVKILLPTLLLIFPAVFVVLAGPAAIQIQQAFGM